MHSILCYGDSNTWGCPPYASITQAPDRIPHARRWPNVMGHALPNQAWIVEEGLSGRTTVFDDPIEGKHKNGERGIISAIETHAPLDLVIMMLGTNDFKEQFRATSFTSARGMLTLVQAIRGHFALASKGVEILIVTPPSITHAAEPATWKESADRAVDHAYYLAQVAERTGCFHFDSNSVVKVGADGVHIDATAHEALGRALATEVAAILRMTATI
jgi:lysophospholipase L1-like esterase